MRAVRTVLVAGVLACLGYGAWSLLALGLDNLVATLPWLAGAVLVHDVVLAPLTLLLGAAAVRATGARSVVLLPNDANTQAVALSAAREAETTGLRVSVVPTRSPVQALAALAVRDPQRSFADDVIAMAEAAGACRYGEVCTAQRDAFTVAGQCRAGDLLGRSPPVLL